MSDTKSTLPEGFSPLNPSRGAVWWRLKTGASIQGVLLGRYEGKMGPYYQLRVTKTAETENKEGESIAVEPGAIVNVDEKSKLSTLVSLCAEKEEQEVFIQAIGKDTMKNGGTVWNLEVGYRGTGKANTAKNHVVISKPAASNGTTEDQLPF